LAAAAAAVVVVVAAVGVAAAAVGLAAAAVAWSQRRLGLTEGALATYACVVDDRAGAGCSRPPCQIIFVPFTELAAVSVSKHQHKSRFFRQRIPSQRDNE
jgi:hypothetical protein